MTADKARARLERRGIKADVRDYVCSDHCGPGPRFIVSTPGRIPVCFNYAEFDRSLRRIRTGDPSALDVLLGPIRRP